MVKLKQALLIYRMGYSTHYSHSVDDWFEAREYALRYKMHWPKGPQPGTHK
jgi:hypothetical protein